MLELETPTIYSILLFTGLAIGLWYIKPDVMFEEDGKMKVFGTGEGKTVFYYPIILMFIGMITFIIVNSIYLRQNNII
jgi:hypothetical protein